MRHFIAIIAAISICISLNGCNKKEDGPTSSGQVPKSGGLQGGGSYIPIVSVPTDGNGASPGMSTDGQVQITEYSALSRSGTKPPPLVAVGLLPESTVIAVETELNPPPDNDPANAETDPLVVLKALAQKNHWQFQIVNKATVDSTTTSDPHTHTGVYYTWHLDTSSASTAAGNLVGVVAMAGTFDNSKKWVSVMAVRGARIAK